MSPALQRWVAHFGSLRTTLVLLALLFGVVLAYPGRWPLTLLFAALATNLVAALVRHPLLRRQGALLVFHLALLALLVLVGVGRLASLDGRFELTRGVPFDGRLIDRAAGPLYLERLERLAFHHEGFEIDYAAGRRRGATRNAVVWNDEGGTLRRAVVGDHRPLVIDGHRFYTTSNKGFAPVLRWEPERGEPVLGSVHLPSFPVHELQQSREWSLPDGRAVWIQLATDEALIDPAVATRFALPERHHLVVRWSDAGRESRAELAPGAAVALPGGTLSYAGLSTWMGYRVSYDPTLPWLLAASLLAALSLAAHYAARFFFDRAAPRTRPSPQGRMAEALTLYMALGAYALAGVAAVLPWWPRTRTLARTAPVLAWPLAAVALAAALALHTLALAGRWQLYGHGPFTTLHEILSSNLWSLALVFALAAAAVREVRPALALAAPVLLVLASWMVMSDPGAGHFPATYDTSLLYIHTVLGKLFLGLLLVALATGAAAALAGTRWALPGLDALRLDALAHRFAAFAFVFETLMLVAGAVWAQDAWGRYWDWDPLESWAFATWVALALALHARATLRPAPRVFALWLLIVFVVAFLTFFGVPFISTAPHKGAV